MSVPSIKIRPRHEARVSHGHPWVFSNEIEGDVSGLPAGGVVDVFEAGGKFVGRGYANPKSLIAVRLLTRARKEDVDGPVFFAGKLREALAFREAIYPGRRSLRLVHGEGDGLPGLVVDRYEDQLVVQINTLGMDVRKESLRAAIEEVLAPRGVVLRSDVRMRELEGLPEDRGVWWGDVDPVVVDEFGVKFEIDPLGAQKTGHFHDQAENRRFVGGLCSGRTVLDAYCNTGGFALHALKHGAAKAIAIDSSEPTCAQAVRNGERNGVGDRLEVVCAEAKATLERFVGEGRRFGVVLLDPPAFAKTRKTASAALKGYRDVNALGLVLVEPGGLFATSSCSWHIEEDRFLEAIVEAADKAGKRLRVVRRGEQAPDHPVVPQVPETRYLKHWVFYVS